MKSEDVTASTGGRDQRISTPATTGQATRSTSITAASLTSGGGNAPSDTGLSRSSEQRAKELGCLLADIPKYGIAPNAKLPPSLMGKTFPQDRYLDPALKAFNEAHAELSDRLNDRHNNPISSEEYDRLELKFLSEAAHAVRASVAYSGESNNAGNMRKDFSMKSSFSNTMAIVHSRAPLILAPLALKAIHEMEVVPDDGTKTISDKVLTGTLLALTLPVMANSANHSYSESNGGNATKMNFDFAGGARHLLGPLAGKPHGPGPAHWGTGAAVFGMIIALTAVSGALNESRGEEDDDSWGKALTDTAVSAFVNLFAVGVYEAVRQLAIVAQNTLSGDESAQMAERMDHRRNQTDVYISQTTFKSDRSRTQGLAAIDTPRGRARLITTAGSVAAGIVAGGLNNLPQNGSAFEKSLLTFSAATLAKWATSLILTDTFNHPKKHPELSSLATTQIRIDDIRNSALEPYIDFSVGLANAALALQPDTGSGFKSAKDVLYQLLSPSGTSLSAMSPSTGGGISGPGAAGTTDFDVRAFAATTFIFDDQKFGDPNSASKIYASTQIVQDQLELFKKDFLDLKEEMKQFTSGTSNHLKRQFDYIEKSTRACEEMLARFQAVVAEEFESIDAPNVGGVRMTFASQANQRGPQGFEIYRQAREAMRNADPSTQTGRDTIQEQQQIIASFCCGPIEGVQLQNLDKSKIPNDALGVAAVAVRETLKAEIYELHTRSMLLASNLTIQNYLESSGTDTNSNPGDPGNNGDLPQRMGDALHKLLPIHTGIVGANFEDVTRGFLADLEKVPDSVLSDTKTPGGGDKSKIFHVLSREAGMRLNMAMLSENIVRQMNSDSVASKETADVLHGKLNLLRDRIDDVANDKARAMQQFARSKVIGIEMREDGIDVTRVKARLDFALNRIKSEANPRPLPANHTSTDFSALHRPLLDNLDKLASSPGRNIGILSKSEIEGRGSPAFAVEKEQFVAQLKDAFRDMTKAGDYKLSVTKFLERLDESFGATPKKLASLKSFIVTELPEMKDFFELAATELAHLIKNPFTAATVALGQSTTVTVSTADAAPAPAANTDFGLLNQQIGKLQESLRAADGDVKTFWDGNLATPIQTSAKELVLHKLADTHRHQSAFANQHENLVDTYQRMKKIGVAKSVIMPIPTLLNHGGQMIDYYTSGTYGISYSPSPRDQREGITAKHSQGAALLPKDGGEQALLKQLGELHQKRVKAEAELSKLEENSAESGKPDSRETTAKKDELRATIAAIKDVFDFYVLSTTVADTADTNKRGMEEKILGQFAGSKQMFGSYLIKMLGENTFNKTNVNSRQPVDTDREAVKNAIMTAAQLGRPFNLHSDAARPGDKQTWFNEVRELLTEVAEGTKALDRAKRVLMEQKGETDAQIASNFKVIWSHAGGIAADARDAVDHLAKLRGLMDDQDLGKHVLVDISWDKTYSVAMKNFQDHLDIQKSKLNDLPEIANKQGADKKAAIKTTQENLKTISRMIESFAMSMDNFSSATTKAHLANRHGLDQTAALSRVAASTPFDLHKEQLANFKAQFEVLFKSDPNLRAVFLRMVEEPPSTTNNNWMGFFVNHSDKIMFGTDALVPHTKVTGEMQYQINALNYYPFFDMIDVMAEYYGGNNNPNLVNDAVPQAEADRLQGVTEDIRHGTFERLLSESNFDAGDQIIDAYLARKDTAQMATSNTPAVLEDVYKNTLVPSANRGTAPTDRIV